MDFPWANHRLCRGVHWRYLFVPAAKSSASAAELLVFPVGGKSGLVHIGSVHGADGHILAWRPGSFSAGSDLF